MSWPGARTTLRGCCRWRVVPAVASVLLLISCGLPDQGRVQTVQDSDVPYDLLDPEGPRRAPVTEAPPVPLGAPVVFWLDRDDRLVPSAVEASCADAGEDVVRQTLLTLTLSPSPEERTAGLSSALPPSSRLQLLGAEDGVAQIELDPVVVGDAERLPLAVGQLVLSVTSAPGVDSVRLLTSGQQVDVPLPGGKLASRPVTADDYAALLPDRLVGSQGPAPTAPPSIGCASDGP